MFQIISPLLILATGMVGGIFSLRLTEGQSRFNWLSLGNAFGGGIFLGAGLIHMLPDAFQGFATIEGGSDFPWAAVTACFSIALVLLLERVVIRGHDAIEHTSATTSRVTPYILTLVLSVHSMIAGIALGAEETVSKASIILFAILAHKGSAAFALGVNLHRNSFSTGRAKRILKLFSFTTPVGVVLGAGLSALISGPGEEIFEAIFDALAAGTFLVIALMDVVGEELSHAKNVVVNFVLFLAGLVLMAVLAAWL